LTRRAPSRPMCRCGHDGACPCILPDLKLANQNGETLLAVCYRRAPLRKGCRPRRERVAADQIKTSTRRTASLPCYCCGAKATCKAPTVASVRQEKRNVKWKALFPISPDPTCRVATPPFAVVAGSSRLCFAGAGALMGQAKSARWPICWGVLNQEKLRRPIARNAGRNNNRRTGANEISA
jgi:hypothetical protein